MYGEVKEDMFDIVRNKKRTNIILGLLSRLQEILCFVFSKARESMQASEVIQNFEIHNLAVMLLVLGIVGISRKLKQELKMSLRHTCRTFK